MYLKRILQLTFLYWVFGKLALLMAVPPGYAAPVWPSAGIALGFVSAFGRRVWPGVLLGSFLVNVDRGFDPSSPETIAGSLVVALAIAGGAAVQAVAGDGLLRRFVQKDIRLENWQSVVRFVVFGGLLSSMVNPTIGVGTLFLSDRVSSANLLMNWATWWGGDTGGIILCFPLTLSWVGPAAGFWRHRRYALSLPLAATVMLNVGVLAFMKKAEDRLVEQRFNQQVQDFVSRLDYVVHDYIDTLHALQAFYHGSEKVEWDEFNKFCRVPLLRYPGIQALSWFPRISRVEAEAEELRTPDGTSALRIWEPGAEGDRVDATGRDEFFPVYYVEPYEENADVLGFDVGSDPTQREALQRALHTGEPAATGLVPLLQEKGVRSFVIFVPVFAVDEIDGDALKGPGSVKGLVAGAFRVPVILHDIFSMISPLSEGGSDSGEFLRYVNFTLQDEGAIGGGEFYRNVHSGDFREAELLQRTIDLDVAGRTWRMNFSPTAEFWAHQRSWAVWLILVAGFLFSGLLGMFLLVVIGQTVATRRQVEERTEELQAAKQQLELEVRYKEKIAEDLRVQAEKLKKQHDLVVTSLASANQARTEAQEAQEQINRIIESSPLGMVIMNRGGKIVMVNRQLEAWFGYARKELTGGSVEMLLPEDRREEYRRYRQRFLSDPASWQAGQKYDLYGRHRKGSEFPIELSLSPVHMQGEVYALITIEDVTERRKTMENLRRSNEELEEFAYLASHDLQEPIRKIIGFATMLREESKTLSDDGKKCVNFMCDGALRMQALVQDLLKYSRASRAEIAFEEVAAGDVVREALGNLEEPIRERQAEIVTGDLPAVWGHRGFLVSVFQNLIGNAIKYQRDGVRPRVEIAAVRNKNMWEFTVQDNGIGIDPQFAERIFQIFQRLHGRNEYSGTGVGLAICRRMIERHGGKVWLANHPGPGSVFKLTLPAGDGR